MMLIGGRPHPYDAVEIFDVLGDDRPILGRGIAEEVLVGQRRQPGIVSRRNDIVAPSSESLGRRGGMVDVKK
jgi:hypothetical protein